MVKEGPRHLESLHALPHQLGLPVQRAGNTEDETLPKDKQCRLSVNDEVTHDAEGVAAHTRVPRAGKITQALDDALRWNHAAIVSRCFDRFDQRREEKCGGTDVADSIVCRRGKTGEKRLKDSRRGGGRRDRRCDARHSSIFADLRR
jgi:hypothetical protein